MFIIVLNLIWNLFFFFLTKTLSGTWKSIFAIILIQIFSYSCSASTFFFCSVVVLVLLWPSATVLLCSSIVGAPRPSSSHISHVHPFGLHLWQISNPSSNSKSHCAFFIWSGPWLMEFLYVIDFRLFEDWYNYLEKAHC